MFMCVSTAAACASRWKRWCFSSPSPDVEESVLIATKRLRTESWALYTWPIVPRPISATILYFPMRSMSMESRPVLGAGGRGRPAADITMPASGTHGRDKLNAESEMYPLDDGYGSLEELQGADRVDGREARGPEGGPEAGGEADHERERRREQQAERRHREAVLEGLAREER